jgi:hypothetical protein
MKKWKCGNFDHACQLRGYCVMKNCSQFKEEPKKKLFCKRLAGGFICYTNELGRLR